MQYKILAPLFLSVTLGCELPASPSKSYLLCKGTAYCSSGTVERIIDGDTIDAGGLRIRLVLVDAPEKSEKGGTESRDYLAFLCPLGSQVLVDQDDWQRYDRYGRMLAVAWCSEQRANERTIADGYASLYKYYCSRSEFGAEEWAKRLGCP